MPQKPLLNVVNGKNNRGNILSDNLFAKNNLEHNFVNSIDGANALKLDESYEIKDQETQNSLIESFESKEESQITEEVSYSKKYK